LRSPDLYFDYNGSTPLHPAVVQALGRQLTELYGNPSAEHPAGRNARSAIDAAQRSIARALGAQAGELYFTSGGTEANNWALFGAVGSKQRAHVVVSAIEHRSVLAAAAELERRGHRITRVGCDAAGAVRVRDVEDALRADTALVSVMYANNETGVVQPVREIAELCRARGVRFHTDVVAALGKLPIDLGALGCDMASFGSHKLYAPKGCGVLYVRSGVELEPMIFGCGQQRGMRSGTENALVLCAFAQACELLQQGTLVDVQTLERLRDTLWRGIEERFPKARRNGGGATLPNTLNVCFPGSTAWELQAELGARGISVTAGAASATASASHVLLAMGLGEERARASLRFSLGAGTSAASIEALLSALEDSVTVRRQAALRGGVA
jgi:cysteine desulfurase